MSDIKTNNRVIKAPTGSEITAKSWATEAPMRMLMNNLDPDVAERPEDLVVYGGIGRAARNWECFDKIVESLKNLEDDETLLVQSGKPVGVFKTHENAPRVLIANSNLVPHWATWDHFNELDKKGLMIKKRGILQSMIIKKPLEIDYENESIDSILEKIEYAIEQHPSFLKVIPQEELEAKKKLDVTRQWEF